ncbi:hypothetical protein AAAT69_19165, partial [Phocaeicola vulgatus]
DIMNIRYPIYEGVYRILTIQQWDNIIDKENRGTRKEGFVALGWYVGFALLAAVVVSAVKSAISGISLSI